MSRHVEKVVSYLCQPGFLVGTTQEGKFLEVCIILAIGPWACLKLPSADVDSL